MDRSDIAHRFCNQDFGKDGHLRCGSVSVEGCKYYSYNTVFAQWVDLKKKVCLVYEGGTSKSSNRHKIDSSYFPSDVHVFPYDDRYFSGGYGYHGCGMWLYGDFEWMHKRQLLDYWIYRQFCGFLAIVGGKERNLERVSFKNWQYVEQLCKLYRDTSVNKWLKEIDRFPGDYKKEVKIMVKLLMKGERNVQVITDAMFGEGAYQHYIDYCERFRKQDKKKAQMEWLCNRLGIDSPYCGGSKYTAAQIRKLTAKERNEIHFNSIAWKAWHDYKPICEEQRRKNKRNAYVWIIGQEPVRENQWSDSYKTPTVVVNKFTGERYDVDGYASLHYHFESWCDHYVEFKYDLFRKSEGKEAWIRDFYAKCEAVHKNVTAQKILCRIKANFREGSYSWYRRYIDDEHLANSTTPEEYAICKDFIERQERYYTDLEARKRAEAIRRQREEEEKRREKELQEKIKQEQIDACLTEGIEGGRKLWRMHFMSVKDAKYKWNPNAGENLEKEFYHGGNVLMRFNMDKTIVETSMSIRIDVATCKKMWRLVQIWHKDPSRFKETRIDTHYSGSYTIVSYENDILTAGCHHIAYVEMERMYNEILENEKAA
mgnify:CR=1 FL=1